MKKIMISYISILIFTQADISIQQIQNMVDQIHQKRPGIGLEALENTKEPFLKVVEENTTVIKPAMKKEQKMTLHAILNDKAYINGKWLKTGDSILGFVLKYIGAKGVVLQSDNQIKKLFLHSNKNNLILIEKKEK